MPQLAEFKHFEAPRYSDLNHVKEAVLRLPGMKNYVPDFASLRQIEDGLEKMTTEVLHDIDAQNMVESITRSMGWAENEKERQEFFGHEDRQPFKSKMEFSESPADRAWQFLTLGTYLRLKYEQLKGKEGEQKARQDFLMFCDYSTQNLFQDASFDFWDEVYGIDPLKRKNGTLEGPTDDMKALIEEETEKVAKRYSRDPNDLIADVYKATENGNFARIMTFLHNNHGKPGVRQALEAIYEKRMSDETLTVKQLQLLWVVETYRKAMGIDLAAYYDMSGLPTEIALTDRLHKSLTDEKSILEFGKHIKEEAPAFNTNRYFDVLTARADHLGLPDELSPREKTDEKVARAEEAVLQLFPPGNLASLAGERFKTYYPHKFGASVTRPVNSSYYNQQSKLVMVNVLNRNDLEDRIKGRNGHEKTHGTHIYVTSAADVKEDPDGATKDSYYRASGVVREAFAKLVESQILKLLRSGQEKGAGDYELWGDLIDALIDRRQRPIGLTQMAVRRKMENFWKAGLHEWDLSEDKAREILTEIGPQLKSWTGEGYSLDDSRATVLNSINIIDPRDGLVYAAARDELKFAFETRFGNMWLSKKDARAILLDLMIKTRDTSDMAVLANHVFRVAGKPEDIKQVYQRLKSWGISEEFI